MHLGFRHCLVKKNFALSDTYYTTLFYLNMAARTDYSGREKLTLIHMAYGPKGPLLF